MDKLIPCEKILWKMANFILANKVYDEDRDKFVPIREKAGNIVVHNIKTVHYSEENKGNNPRYTWYLEFRTIDQSKSYSP